MGRISLAVRIAGPPDAIFPWLCEPDRVPRWVTGLTEMRPNSGVPVGSGWRALERMEIAGRAFERESEIVQWHPPLRLALRTRSRSLDSTTHYTLEEAGAISVLRVEQSTRYTTVAGWLLSRLVDRANRHKLAMDLMELKRLVESA